MLRLRDIMTTDALTVSRDDRARGDGAVGASPRERRPGREWRNASSFFADLWDDAGAEVTGRIANPSTPEWNVLEEHDRDDEFGERRDRDG